MQILRSNQVPDLFDGDKQVVTVQAALMQETVFVDVRTPGEFVESSIVGAINCPLFDNEERSKIGTLYKQINRETAIQLGMDLVDQRLQEFVEKFLPVKDQLITVYCARGGMRSVAVVRLLKTLGFRVQQLVGGFKSYRHFILKEMEQLCPQNLIVIHGKTGVGKTRLLHKLPRSIDLEDMAQHKSSLFGAINNCPRSQKSFDSHLYAKICKLPLEQPIFIEGESRKIGDVFIPNTLFDAMKKGTMVLVNASLNTRIERIIQDYAVDHADTYEEFYTVFQKLRPALSNHKVDWLCECLKKGDFPCIVETLLLDYYDPRYQHAMKNYHYALEVSAENLQEASDTLIAFQKSLQN
ncbi:MAG: tRNA 2-selenouridine(34) synthase MnmH [SAR324 cluster bacterium]|nr:tRNA 2-selenouridine(34) synthase MnmH [SAR324 cluster bacterium]